MRRDALRAAGVETEVLAKRAPGIVGITYDVELVVRRQDRVDSFAWTAYRRRWFGSAERVADVEQELLRVLDLYLQGERP